MGDLNEQQAAQTIKITGSDSTGTESYYANVTNVGRLMTDTVITNTSQNYLVNNQLYSFGIGINLATSGIDNPAILLRNPVGSGKNIFIYRISNGCAVANVAVTFDLYSMPTVTANGTTIPIPSRFVNNGASSCVALATYTPTVTSTGTCLARVVTGQNTNSMLLVNDFSIGIAPGGSILVTGNPSSNNRLVAIEVAWAEVSI